MACNLQNNLCGSDMFPPFDFKHALNLVCGKEIAAEFEKQFNPIGRVEFTSVAGPGSSGAYAFNYSGEDGLLYMRTYQGIFKKDYLYTYKVEYYTLGANGCKHACFVVFNYANGKFDSNAKSLFNGSN